MRSYQKMKDEEFQKKLELILERFEKIDLEVNQYLDRDRISVRNEDYKNKSYSNDMQIQDNKYKKENSDVK